MRMTRPRSAASGVSVPRSSMSVIFGMSGVADAGVGACTNPVHATAAMSAAITSKRLHDDRNVDPTGMREMKADREFVAHAQIVLQSDEHDVIAARFERDRLPRRNGERRYMPHRVTSVHLIRLVNFSRVGDVGARAVERVVGAARIGDREEYGAHVARGA